MTPDNEEVKTPDTDGGLSNPTQSPDEVTPDADESEESDGDEPDDNSDTE